MHHRSLHSRQTAHPARLQTLAGWLQLLEKQQTGRVQINQRLQAQRLANKLLTVSHEALTQVRPQDAEFATVKSVPDGDGLKLTDRRRVRYLGIDAPEVAKYGNPPEPNALAAKALNERLVAGKRVLLVSDVTDTDRYGRLLRYVFADGVFVNAALLLAGLAKLFVIEPDDRFAALLGGCTTAK